MKYIMTALLMLGLTTTAYARTGDYEHFNGSLLIGDFLYNAGATPDQARLGCLAVGATKEFIDLLGFGDADPIDMIINTGGCILGTVKIRLDKPISEKYCKKGVYKGKPYWNRPECCKFHNTCGDN